jgi:hypothetical protein
MTCECDAYADCESNTSMISSACAASAAAVTADAPIGDLDRLRCSVSPVSLRRLRAHAGGALAAGGCPGSVLRAGAEPVSRCCAWLLQLLLLLRHLLLLLPLQGRRPSATGGWVPTPFPTTDLDLTSRTLACRLSGPLHGKTL